VVFGAAVDVFGGVGAPLGVAVEVEPGLAGADAGESLLDVWCVGGGAFGGGAESGEDGLEGCVGRVAEGGGLIEGGPGGVGEGVGLL